MSSGSSFCMIAMSRLMLSGVSAGKPRIYPASVMMPSCFPGEQHLAIFRDLVLAFLGRREIVGIDVLQADEHPGHAGAFRLRNEARDLVAQRVDLDHQADRNPINLPKPDEAIEDRLPLPVARKIIVGDEELVDALRPVEAQQMFDVVGRTMSATRGPAR